jgi:ketosteroid isomerase-like protein
MTNEDNMSAGTPLSSGADLLRAFGDCLARGDASGAAALFALDAVYEEPPVHFAGREAIHTFIAEFAATHSDARFEILRALASPDGALLAAEWRWSYMRSAGGTQRTFAGISFVELRDGLIAHWRGFSAPVASSHSS